MERETLTAKEAAEILGLSAWTLYDLARQRKVPHIRVGRRVLFRKESLLSWLSDLEIASTAKEQKQTGKLRKLEP